MDTTPQPSEARPSEAGAFHELFLRPSVISSNFMLNIALVFAALPRGWPKITSTMNKAGKSVTATMNRRKKMNNK